MTVSRVNDTFTVTMSKDEFIGVFRTIGDTNHIDRMSVNGSAILTREESKAVSQAFYDSMKTAEVDEERK